MKRIVFIKLVPPFLIAMGLLVWGIYLGTAYRPQILDFERNYLGMSTTLEGETLPNEQPLDQPDDERQLAPSIPEDHKAEISAKAELPLTTKPPNLSDNLDLPVIFRIKALVDSEYITSHSDWISLIQQTVSEASQVYQDNFGIKLRLVGIVRWPIATTGHGFEKLHTDITSRPREGADILLGFVNRSLNSEAYALSTTDSVPGYNGSYGIVGYTNGTQQTFARGLLRSLGHLLGANTIFSETSEDYRLGSWMSTSPSFTRQAPWIDAENRRCILSHKTRPFAPEKNESSTR